MPLDQALRALYAREINVTLTLLYDAGLTVRVWDSEREFRPEEFGEIGDWLIDQTKPHRYRVTGYGHDGAWKGPVELDTAGNQIQTVLRNPERFPELADIATPVGVEAWSDGQWVGND